MVRIVKEYDERKTEILQTALGMFYRHGYENTSVNMICQEIGISKGGFYHYFGSKDDLIPAISEMMGEAYWDRFEEIFDNSSLNALDKFNTLFRDIYAMKADNADQIIATIRGLYRDENIVFMQKLMRSNVKLIAPYFIEMIEQGNREGLFDVPYPEYTVQMTMMMMNELSQQLANFVVEGQGNEEYLRRAMELSKAYESAVERLLGVTGGHIHTYNEESLRKFFGL